MSVVNGDVGRNASGGSCRGRVGEAETYDWDNLGLNEGWERHEL